MEESGLPRLYRDAPLNSIWEGSGNVVALDVLRAAGKQPHAVEALFAELALATGADARLDEAVAGLRSELSRHDPTQARRLATRVTLVLQGSLLVRFAPRMVAGAARATRLIDSWGLVAGMFTSTVNCSGLVARAAPVDAS